MLKKTFIALFCFFFLLTAFADKASVLQTGQQWASALSSRDPQNMIALYDNQAILYATFQNMLNTRKQILNYFRNLMQKKGLSVKFSKQNVRLYGNNVAINSGGYTFSYDKNGKMIKVPARYTFVYYKTPQGWKIVDHHSSILPE